MRRASYQVRDEIPKLSWFWPPWRGMIRKMARLSRLVRSSLGQTQTS